MVKESESSYLSRPLTLEAINGLEGRSLSRPLGINYSFENERKICQNSLLVATCNKIVKHESKNSRVITKNCAKIGLIFKALKV